MYKSETILVSGEPCYLNISRLGVCAHVNIINVWIYFEVPMVWDMQTGPALSQAQNVITYVLAFFLTVKASQCWQIVNES